MHNRKTDRIIRFVLFFGWLLTSTAPPALRHAHSNGHMPHDHLAISDLGSEFDHNWCCDDFDEAKLIPAAEPHLHFSWLGINVTLPCPSDVDERGPSSQGATIQGAVRLPDDWTVLGGTAVAEQNWPVPAVCQPQFDPSTLRWTASLKSTAAVATSLCDNARHERSGVQLI